ncbi:MAG: Uma2 family endonuclease [Blautia sp.]|nr:Uma2 family endonuclease [Blautia sp.]
MSLQEEKTCTVSYIESLPEGKRAELIDGVVYDMGAPAEDHQIISGEIFTDINLYIRQHQGKCKVFAAPYAVYLDQDDLTYVEPDITVVCDDSRRDKKGCHGAPDWILEIVSPSTRARDYFIKLFKYRSAGVREYWIVDPDKRKVRTYDLVNDDTADYGFDEFVPAMIFPGFSLRIGDYI